MKFKKVMLIYNGEAGQNDLDKTLGECVPVIAAGTEELLLMATQRPGHAREICQEYGGQMDAVFILGGDGTVHEVINGIAPLPKRPILGILPNGTCNDFSRTLNIPQNIKKAAQALMEGNVIDVDAGRADESYFLNFWGIGLIAEASNNIDPGQKKMLGKVSYLLSALRTIHETPPFPFRITYEGKVIEDTAVMILVLNGKFIGTNALPFPNIQTDDGLFDVVIVKNSNLAMFRELMNLKKTWQAGNAEENELLYFQARNLSIETSAPMEADMDGEVYQQTPAEIVILKQHLSFFYYPEVK
ncbi:diacylglycerol/lipid kinase family protein [Peribacillus sp. SCS-37]|uniref:diacylglycerol/lipid kinase family protein n=1 Tax=Paraperibacillus esterisolvens TaxID=3115296 RepID=UPI003905E5E0